MRGAIAEEKGEDERWDLKHAAGGLVDLEFIAQYLALVHAEAEPEILDTHTGRVLDAARQAEADSPRKTAMRCVPPSRSITI
jgi:[glutamine synthetase] adenylyltransferase / [glutamine synthetase]-adenylyl-L-tyrosine phosphorylase